MKILLIHPGDDPLSGAWINETWDAVFDLGIAGPSAYKRWSGALGCTVQMAEKICDAEFTHIRQFLGSMLGTLVDAHGLDWWDLISLEFHSQLEQWARLAKLARRFGACDEVFVSREGFESRALRALVGSSVKTIPSKNSIRRNFSRYRRLLSSFSSAQLIQMVGDKYDAGYGLRRHFSQRPQPAMSPVVLLPSAYINVSRMELQFAAALPDSDFLLVATRPSGLPSSAPANVAMAKLASYTPGNPTHEEFRGLLCRWQALQKGLASTEPFGEMVRCGAMDAFPNMLRNGLLIRDAWLQVFEREPVRAVLCADDANLPTRIPLQLAERRGLPALACHHGALDGRHRFRPQLDGLFLAKSRMEQDYLVTVCGKRSSSIEIAAPCERQTPQPRSSRRSIVFFSEPFEILGGRALEFYRDVLPPLAECAAASKRDLAIKLHPAESAPERIRFAKAVLSADQFSRLRIVKGPLTPELLDRTWFGLTVLSTTALECTLQGVPSFLCGWLDYSSYGYLDQMVKFGAGVRLDSPDDILHIPEKLNQFHQADADLWEPASSERLEELLTGDRERVAVAV